MKDDLPWMLDATVRTGLRDFRRRELHIRAVRLRRRLLGAANRFWRFRDGRLTGFRAQRRADHAARLLRRAARPGRILKLMADKRGKRIHTITSAPRMPGGRGNHAQKNPPGGSGGRGAALCYGVAVGISDTTTANRTLTFSLVVSSVKLVVIRPILRSSARDELLLIWV